MIIKEAAERGRDLQILGDLLKESGLSQDQRVRIEQEKRNILAGQRGEKDAAYHLNFHYARSENWAVLHDLRIECRGRVAQIDHLLLNRLLEVYVVETKHFAEGVAINETGECTTFWKGVPKGIPSPHEQNARHIAVLNDVFQGDALRLPTRLGIRIAPSLRSLVLVSPSARISRPKTKGWWSEGLVKADQIPAFMERVDKATNPLALAKLISNDTLRQVATDLARLHKPLDVNWRARFAVENDPGGTAREAVMATEAPDAKSSQTPRKAPKCDACGVDVEMKVVHFCRFNKARFGGKTICQACQPKLPVKAT